MNSVDHLLITGANGYIGRRLVALAQERGIAITVLGRRGLPGASVRVISWNLGDPVPASAFQPEGRFGPVTCVVHLAHDWKADEQNAGDLVNVEGAQHLLATTRAARVARVLVASSQSATPAAKNAYGRAKYRIEEMLEAPREIAVRIGFVYGGGWGGPAGTLLRIARRWRVIPAVAPAAPLQPVHVEDVARGLLALATASEIDSPYVVLAGAPVSFLEFTRALSNVIDSGRPIPLPVPVQAIDLFAAVGLIPPAYRERLLGLVALQKFDRDWDPRLTGFLPRSLDEGLRPLLVRTQRRRLLIEAASCLRYVLGEAPGRALLRRYVTAVRRWDGAEPIGLPSLARWIPAAMRLFEPLRRESPLKRRIDIAMTLADASPVGFRRFYPGGTGYGSVLKLAVTLMVEACLLPLRLWLGRR